MKRCRRDGIASTTISAALKRKHGFRGSKSPLRRIAQRLAAEQREAIVILEFAPSEVVQVDFGKGEAILDPRTGELTGTWNFVMTMA